MFLGSWSDAEAKRFGGARSFGGKSSFSSPYRRSATPTRSASQQKSYQKNQAARQTMSRRGGLMGMLGGLALGGLLGALFFGGAFEGLNMFDLLIFGGIAYLLFKMFAARSANAGSSSYNTSSYGGYDVGQNSSSYGENKYHRNQDAGFDTDVMFKHGVGKHNFSGAQQDISKDADFSTIEYPKGFDERDFLAGAKNAYVTLQKAWDNRDLAEIRGLTTDKVFAEIQYQLQTSGAENKTDILKLEAELLDVREIGSELEAVVLFNSILREDDHAQASQVQEVWHFLKPKNNIQPKWYLDGIQQLEN